MPRKAVAQGICDKLRSTRCLCMTLVMPYSLGQTRMAGWNRVSSSEKLLDKESLGSGQRVCTNYQGPWLLNAQSAHRACSYDIRI